MKYADLPIYHRLNDILHLEHIKRLIGTLTYLKENGFIISCCLSGGSLPHS